MVSAENVNTMSRESVLTCGRRHSEGRSKCLESESKGNGPT